MEASHKNHRPHIEVGGKDAEGVCVESRTITYVILPLRRPMVVRIRKYDVDQAEQRSTFISLVQNM